MFVRGVGICTLHIASIYMLASTSNTRTDNTIPLSDLWLHYA